MNPQDLSRTQLENLYRFLDINYPDILQHWEENRKKRKEPHKRKRKVRTRTEVRNDMDTAGKFAKLPYKQHVLGRGVDTVIAQEDVLTSETRRSQVLSQLDAQISLAKKLNMDESIIQELKTLRTEVAVKAQTLSRG